MTSLTNTHYYDGKLANCIISISAAIHRVSVLRKEEHFRMFSEIRNKLIGHINALRNFDVIVADYMKDANFDNINKGRAEYLLYLVCELSLVNESCLEMLICQLEEMSSGMCPQGRFIRLLQHYMAYRQ